MEDKPTYKKPEAIIITGDVPLWMKPSHAEHRVVCKTCKGNKVLQTPKSEAKPWLNEPAFHACYACQGEGMVIQVKEKRFERITH